MRVHGFVRVAVLLGVVVVAALSNHPTAASPHQAHRQYMVGVRAYAATRHAAMLYHEASAESLDLILSRENAAEMERLAREILAHLAKLAVDLPPEDARAVASHLDAMTRGAEEARRRSAELRPRIDGIRPPASVAARAEITGQARRLFALFQAILREHKAAEQALGVPPPPDPPPASEDARDGMR